MRTVQPRERSRRMRMIMHMIQTSAICPTIREMAARAAMTNGSIVRVVNDLVADGWLRRLPRQARALEVIRRVEFRDQYFVFDEEAKELKPWVSSVSSHVEVSEANHRNEKTPAAV